MFSLILHITPMAISTDVDIFLVIVTVCASWGPVRNCELEGWRVTLDWLVGLL